MKKKASPDFSRSAIKKVVLKKAVTHPLTLFPLAAGLGGVFATVLFASPIMLVASAALVAASGDSIQTNGKINLPKAAAQLRRKIRKALKVGLPDFALNRKKALRAVNKMKKALVV